MPKSRCRTQHASGREGKVVVGGRLGRSLPAGPVPNGPTRTPRRRGAGTQSIGPHSLPKVDSEVIEGGPEHFGWCTSQLDGQRVDRCAKRIVIRKLTQFRGELVHSLKVRTLWPGSQPRAYTGGRDGRVLIFPFKTVLRIFRKSRMVCAILVS